MLQVTGVGRLGRDPEMRYLPTGTAVTNFSVAVDCGYGEKKVTAWVRVSCFGQMAETMNKYLKKGSRIFLIAEYNPDKETGNPRTYTGKDDVVMSVLEVKATHIEFLSDIASKEELEAEPEVF